MLLANFQPFVATDVIGCPDPTIKQAIALAAIEFCRETLSWTVINDPIQLMAGVNEYDIDTPSSATVLTVRDVWLGNTRLVPITLSELQTVMPDWRTGQASDPVYYNMAGDPALLRVFPTPSTTNQMVIRAAYVPTLSATTLPDFLTIYVETIASGAKARLLLIPGTTWSNPELGAYHRTIFDQAILSTRIEEAHDRVPGTIRVAPRSFGF